MKSNRRLGALALAAGAVVCGCSTEPIFKHRPGKTFGEIYVGDVRVSSRERLVNDRLIQDQWLQDQLKNSDTVEFGTQGASDQRSATLSSTRIEANLDQTQVGAYRAQQSQTAEALRRQNELAELDAQLQRQYKQRQLEFMQQQQPGTAFAYTPPSAAPQGPQATTPPTGPAATDDLRKLKDDLSKFTIPPNQIVFPDKLKPTPQDVLRDRLEYRGVIRNEIIKNSLDDRHDLKGHTLLRFDLDATVRPHEDTSAWAIVEVEVDRGETARQCDEGLGRRWAEHLEREIYENTLRIMRAAFPNGRLATAGMESATPVRRAEAFVGGMVATLPDHILFEIQRDWLESKGYGPIPLQNVSQDIKGEMLNRESAYATASAIVLHLGRKGRPADKVPMEDYVRELHLMVANAYVDFAKDVAPGLVVVRRDGTRVTVAVRNPVEFCKTLISTINLYAYGTTPEESVQRITEVASRRNFNEVMLAMNFLAGNAAAGKAYFDLIKVNEGIFQALRRQPLAVGFNRGTANGNAQFGWILGPRFSIRDDGREANFRHTLSFTPLSGVLSLPGWMKEVSLKVSTYWVTESGKTDAGSFTNAAGVGAKPGAGPFWLSSDEKQQLEHGPDFPGRFLSSTKTVKVRLREDLTTIAEAISERSFRAPRAFVRQQFLFAEGSPAQVTIPGQNLWRSPTVLIGGQQANQVLVLPDMRGIIARFNEIKLPDTPERGEKLPLTVWTSEGHTDVGLVTIKPIKPAEPKLVAALSDKAVIGGKETSIRLNPPQRSFYQMKLWVGVDSGVANEAVVSEVSIDGTTAKVTIPELKNARSGEGALLQVTIKEAPDNRPAAPFGGPIASVYFAKEEDTKATVSPKSLALAQLETPFVVTLPVKATVLYPGSEGPIEVKLAAKPGSPELKISACTLENGKNLKPGQCAFKVEKPAAFTSDGEYTMSIVAKTTKIPVEPETIKVTQKVAPPPPPKPAAENDGGKNKAAKAQAKRDAGKDAAARNGAVKDGKNPAARDGAKAGEDKLGAVKSTEKKAEVKEVVKKEEGKK